MVWRSIACGLVCLVTTGDVLAAEPDKPASKPVEGKLSLGSKSVVLAHVVAYETKVGDETLVAVLASDRKIPMAQIVTALRENKGSDDHLSLDQPFLKLYFRPSGESAGCSGSIGSTFFSAGVDDPEFKLVDGRALGRASMPEKGEGNLKRSFDVKFDVPVGLDRGPKPAAKPAAAVKPLVTGTFKGNGKPAKLAFVSARAGEPFGDKPSIVLVFTEKDHSREARPDIKAAFGSFGSALIISLHEDGKIFGCEVSHAAHSNKTFSSIGTIHAEDFELTDDGLSGRLTTDGEQKFFEQTWEVDLKFAAPLVRPTAPAPVAADKKKPASQPGPVPGKKAARAEPVAAINIHDFPFPKDAAQIEYKTIVEQMGFSSPSSGVQAMAAELTKQLAAQGWKSDDSDLVTPKSAILNRNRGQASLTIFVKPEGKGSRVSVMTEGLDWTEKEK